MKNKALPLNTSRADEKLEAALDLIEQAQNTLDRACQQLCPIRGGAAQWQAIAKLSDACKHQWYTIRDLVGANNGMSLDSEPATGLDRDL